MQGRTLRPIRMLAVLLVAATPAAGEELDPGSPLRVACAEVVVELGGRTELLESGWRGLTYFPDQGVSTLETSPLLRLLVTARFSTYLVAGPSLRALRTAREVLAPGDPNDFDNGYAGVGGVYSHPDGRLFAFYHAEDWRGMERFPAGMSGFFAQVGEAVSSDGGASWSKLGPAVSSAKPKTWRAFPSHRGRGAGFPSVVVSADGSTLLLYYNDLSHVDQRGVQVFLARAELGDGDPVPGRFRKYHEGGFAEPGLGGRDTPVLSALHLDGSAAVQPFVIRSERLERYVMFFHVQAWKEHPDLHDPPRPAGAISGLYVAVSQDGVAWSEPCKLFSDRAFPEVGKSISWETGVIQEDGDDARGWLVYGYSPSWGPGGALAPGPPHFMVGRRLSLTRAAPVEPAAAGAR